MDIIRIAEDFAISPQIVRADIAHIAARGFRGIVNNRPDGEAPDQPASAELEAEARRHGLAYWHIPFAPGAMSDADVHQLHALRREADGPLLGLCRTGTRAAQLWALTEVPKLSVDAVIGQAARAGVDLEAFRPRLLEAAGID
jgi:sulfide:quinone oxidoreductase